MGRGWVIVAGVLALLLGLSPAAAASLDELRARALALVNQSRLDHGLMPLRLARDANQAAQAHADDMRKRRYYGHVSPEGHAVKERYLRAGGSRSRATAENIAQCPECVQPPGSDMVERLHRGWMDSPGHRENILREGLTVFGFGIAVDRARGLYAVQAFAGPGIPRNLRPDDRRTSLSSEEQVLQAVERFNRARHEQRRLGLRQSPALGAAALSLLAERSLDDFRLGDGQNVRAALPAEQRDDWRSIGALAGICGGCGTDATAVDVRYFVQLWLDDPKYRDMLLDPAWSHVGFAIAVDGEGRKVALGVLGQKR